MAKVRFAGGSYERCRRLDWPSEGKDLFERDVVGLAAVVAEGVVHERRKLRREDAEKECAPEDSEATKECDWIRDADCKVDLPKYKGSPKRSCSSWSRRSWRMTKTR